MPAYVTNPTSRGCFLRLSHGISGLVQMRHLSDDFVTNPAQLLPVGKLVKARVLKVNHAQSSVLLTLKRSALSGNAEAQEQIQNLAVGQTVQGTVQRVTEAGVFVAIDGTRLVGLSRAAAALQDNSKSLQDEYAAGDVVQCKVLSVSRTSLKVGLGLRPSYFTADEDSDACDEDDNGEDGEEEQEIDEDDEDDDDDDGVEEMDVEEDEEEADDDDDDDDDDSEDGDGDTRVLKPVASSSDSEESAEDGDDSVRFIQLL